MTFTVINASAGSGKTHALTAEIADRVEGSGVRPSQIIATTFTKKAAAELADRVRAALLDRGLVEQARAVPSALISTVNAVAGTILTEHAIDAGLSPDIRVLDEDSQKHAFRTAIDSAAAAASVVHGDLLARLEHDGDEGSTSFADRAVAWTRQVREIADLARSNGISADDLRAAAAASFREMREEVLPPADAEDLRPRWAHLFARGIASLRAELDEGGIPSGSVGNVQAALDDFPAFARRLEQSERLPWSQWARLANVSTVPASKKAGVRVQPHFAALEAEIHERLLASPVLQADVEALIGLILGTAADSLDAYARYKQELGLIDFVDQEVLTLRLVREDERVRSALRSRFRLLAVDEFQDTSPVQLDLFLALAELVEEVVWVGDPKQAIYGFRGTDPALMRHVVDRIEQGGERWGVGRSLTLTESWRSGQAVLDLAGTVFSRLFSDMPRDRVVLGIPEERRATAAPGRIETWLPSGSGTSIAHHATVIAGGVAELLADPGVVPGDIAVLVRNGSHRDEVVAALQARGIPTTGPAVAPLATREGMIVRAGLAAALDGSDTLAVTELVTLLEDHAAHDTWFADLTAAPDRASRRALVDRWRTDPSLARLEELRTRCIGFTPTEMLAVVIDALDLPQRIKRWTAPETRRLTLDALRAVAAAYEETCRAEGRPVTLTALRMHLESEAGRAHPGGTAELPDAVWVGTIHGAKGLEWRHVVVMVPKEAGRARVGGTRIIAAAELDLARPLAGRSLRFRPQVLPSFGPLKEAALASGFSRARAAEELAEEGRLYYVALTRARETVVLSAISPRHALGSLLGPDGPDLIAWDAGGIRVDGRGEPLPALVRELPVEASESAGPVPPVPSALSATDVPLRPAVRATPERSAARFRASGLPSTAADLLVSAPRRLGPPLVERGGKDWDRVGEAVHAYLALPLAELSDSQRTAAAERLVERWLVGRALGAPTLLEAGGRWLAFVAAELPGAELLTEQPIAWWNEDAQAMEGWIDTLLRLPDGSSVLVDHKTYPGEDPASHVREHYLGQFEAYSRALEAAGHRVARMLVHLPLRSEVLEVFRP